MKVMWVAIHLMLVGWWFATEARAEETTESGATQVLDDIDDALGSYVVQPLAAVMFFDLMLWDDALPRDASVIGTEVDEGTIVGVDETGFRIEPRHVLTDPPVLAGNLKLGPLTAAVSRASADAPLIAKVAEQDADLAALGVDPWPETPAPDDPAIVEATSPVPFLVHVDRERARVLAAEGEVPDPLVRLAVGMTVATPEGEAATVQSIDADGTVIAVASVVTRASLPDPNAVTLPLVVAWLVLGAVFFTLRMAFVNLRMFPHALLVVTGAYDHADAEGEISHFQALSSALSATVGLGNIAGVAIAVSAGGPGAIFWMVIAGFLGMSSKFTECTLGQMYRTTRPDGSVSGGPMHYLDVGLGEMGLGTLGKVLAVVFAVLCIGGSFGGGNMFQANQSFQAVAFVATDYGLLSDGAVANFGIVYGVVLTFLVGLVIIGGIQRIGAAAGLIVPFMCVVYVLAGLFILLVHASDVPTAFMTIIREAFSPQAAIVGGFVGVLVQGFRRAAFSNEAGVGSASIAHSAATTKYPVREGIVALLEPFVDTIVVCTMTGLVVVITGAYQSDTGGNGVVMTQQAFGSVMSWFPLLLSLAVVLFAFSTMISWSYYGERCSIWLFGDQAKLPYRVVFLVFVFLGANLELGNVLEFSDLMILGMAFPNILGAVLLSTKVKEALDDYVTKLRAGEFEITSG